MNEDELQLPLYGRGLPPELRAAVDDDPALGPAIAALAPKDKSELVERLFGAPDPDRRRARLSRACETILDHAAGRRDTALDVWPKPSAMVDQLLKDVIAADLKARGFRKKGRRWSCEDDRGERTVRVDVTPDPHAGKVQVTVDGRQPGARYVLGASLQQLRAEPFQFYSWQVDDPEGYARAEAELTEDWDRIGRPLVEALPDPVAATELFFALGADQHHLDQARYHLTDEPGHAAAARRIDDRYFELWPELSLPGEEAFAPLECDIPSRLEMVRSWLQRIVGADRSLSPDQRASIVAFVERCRTALATEPDIADAADPDDARAVRAVAVARREDRDRRHGDGRSAEALADVDLLLASLAAS
jgi:hypothetical protein